MKKIFILLLVLTTFVFIGCSQYVKKIEEEPQSYGKDITFYTVDSNSNYTFYTLLLPDSPIYGTPTFFIRYFPKGADHAESVKKFENAEVGEIYKENGVIKSIVINNKKYVSY